MVHSRYIVGFLDMMKYVTLNYFAGSFRNVLRGCSRIYSGQKTVYDAAQKGQQSSYHCATRSHLSYRSVFWHYALNKPSPYYCASKILQQSPYHCVPRNPLPQCAVYSHDTFNPALTNFWTNNARLYSTNKGKVSCAGREMLLLQ